MGFWDWWPWRWFRSSPSYFNRALAIERVPYDDQVKAMTHEKNTTIADAAESFREARRNLIQVIRGICTSYDTCIEQVSAEQYVDTPKKHFGSVFPDDEKKLQEAQVCLRLCVKGLENGASHLKESHAFDYLQSCKASAALLQKHANELEWFMQQIYSPSTLHEDIGGRKLYTTYFPYTVGLTESRAVMDRLIALGEKMNEVYRAFAIDLARSNAILKGAKAR